MAEQPKQIVVYGRPACPMVPPVLNALDTAGAPYQYVDILQDWEARERVRAINGGNESVPTLLFPDGSTLTEPGLAALREQLTAAGYSGEALDSLGARIGYTLRNPTYLFMLLALAATLLAVLVFS